MRFVRVYENQLQAHTQVLTLSESAHHHLSRVLRMKLNDELQLFNGKGFEALAVITAQSKKATEVHIKNSLDNKTESHLNIHLYQALCRFEKMDWIIQKATELGATSITPIFTEHCAVKLPKDRKEKRMTHWQDVMINACEQSNRNVLVQLNSPITFEEAVLQKTNAQRFILHPWQETTQKLQKNNHDIDLFIGPEGGFSENEIKHAIENTIACLQLGPRVLRTETAGLAAITYCQTLLGDFNVR